LKNKYLIAKADAKSLNHWSRFWSCKSKQAKSK